MAIENKTAQISNQKKAKANAFPAKIIRDGRASMSANLSRRQGQSDQKKAKTQDKSSERFSSNL